MKKFDCFKFTAILIGEKFYAVLLNRNELKMHLCATYQ